MLCAPRLVWIARGLGVMVRLFAGFQAAGVPGDIFDDDARVRVTRDPAGFAYRRLKGGNRTGPILLPGGMVEPEAHAPPLRAFAEAGYPARPAKLPWRCACTAGPTIESLSRVRGIIEGEPRAAASRNGAGGDRGRGIRGWTDLGNWSRFRTGSRDSSANTWRPGAAGRQSMKARCTSPRTR